MERKNRLLVLFGLDTCGGYAGVKRLVEFTQTEPKFLQAEIVGIVSDTPRVSDVAGVSVQFFPAPYSAKRYLALMKRCNADYLICYGWPNTVRGIAEAKVIEINFGPAETENLIGEKAHKEVMHLYRLGKITQSAITLQFGSGAVISKVPILIRANDIWTTLQKRSNEIGVALIAHKLSEIVNGFIFLHPEDSTQAVFMDHNPKKPSF